MNTRIQVEHAVTEMITGMDLVTLQLRFAAGEDLSYLLRQGIEVIGHAIECRLYAENPDRMFLPTPGTLSRLVFPVTDRRVRIDTGVRQGDRVTHHYDPMVAKIIVGGETREESLKRMSEILRSIEIEGLITNLKFLQHVIESQPFIDGESFTDFVEKHKSILQGN
jgi:acetyl/propionyl-CoA carboxylase alpha subunit